MSKLSANSLTTTTQVDEAKISEEVSERRSRFWICLLLIEQAIVIGTSTLLQRSSAPILYTDEMGYLAAAVELSHRSASPFLAHMASYSVGYSAIVSVPLSVIGGDPWRIAVAVNVIAVLALPVLAFNLITKLSDISGFAAAAAAAAAGAYPAVILHVTRAWPEAILPSLILLWATVAISSVRHPSPRTYACLSAAASLLYVVHHRTVSVAGATAVFMIVMVIFSARKRDLTRLKAGLIGLFVLVAVLIIGRGLEQHVASAIYLDHSFDRTSYVLNGFRPGGWQWTGRVLLGQVWYLLIASLGLAGVAANRIIRCLRERGELFTWTLLVSLAFLGTLAVGSAAIGAGYLRTVGPSDRVDTFVYGRYIEIFIPLLIVIALGIGHRAKRDDLYRMLRVPVSLIAVLTMAIIVIRSSDAFTNNYQKVNLYGILGYEMLEGHLGAAVRPRLDIAIIAVGGLSVCAAMVAAARRSTTLATLMIWAVFVSLSFSAAAWTLRPWLNIFEQSSSTAAPFVEESGQVAAVVDGPARVRIESLTSLLYRAGYPPVEIANGDVCPNSEFVVAGDSWLPQYPAEAVVDLEPFGGRLYRVSCSP